jgi:hypothetical protein
MERRKFTREFKLEAMRLIKIRGVSYAQASQDLGGPGVDLPIFPVFFPVSREFEAETGPIRTASSGRESMSNFNAEFPIVGLHIRPIDNQ